MSSTELIFDKSLAKIHDSYRKSIKIVAIEHLGQVLNEVDNFININKVMFHILWDGSFEDIHSYLSFGEYLINDNNITELEDYDIRNSNFYDPLDGYVVDFFGDDIVNVPPYLINSANHFMQIIATDACLFDVIITAVKDKSDGKFKFDVKKISDF